MINSTPTFEQVETTYLIPPRNSSAVRSENELVEFLEKYYSLFLLIFGTVGNLLCLAVLSRETFRRSSAGIYLRFLTVSDLAAIYTGVLFFTARALFNNNFRKIDELSCKFHRWLSFTACDLSSWALVLVSTARLLSIAWPMKRLITRTRVYISILITIIVLLGANLPIFIIYGDVRDPVKNRTSLCVFTQESYEDFYIYVFSWLVLVKFGFLPGVLLIVLNAALVLTVSRSGRAVDQVVSRKSHSETSSGPNIKTRISERKEATVTVDSRRSTLDLESLELSTGSEVSDRTLSGDRNEVIVTNKGNIRLVRVWGRFLRRLKCKSSLRPPEYRLKESSFRDLFCGIQMMWQGGQLESQKDLVSQDEDMSNWSHGKQETAEDKKQSKGVGKETDFSWLDEGVNYDPENMHDLTSDKVPGQRHGDATNMADTPEVQNIQNGLSNCGDLQVNLPTRMSTRRRESVPSKFSTDQTGPDNKSYDLTRSSASCNNHSSIDYENVQLQHVINATSPPITTLNTTFVSNNIWTLSVGQLYPYNIEQTQTGQSVIDKCPDINVGLVSQQKINVTDDFTARRDTERHVNAKDDLSPGDCRNCTNQETRISFRDRHSRREGKVNIGNNSANHDTDINMCSGTPSILKLGSSHSFSHSCIHSCIHRCSHSCIHRCTHGCSQVDYTQRHEYLTCHHRCVCKHSISENCDSLRDIRRSKGDNPTSCGCVYCRAAPEGCAKSTESVINTDEGELCNTESILPLSCSCRTKTADIRSEGDVNNIEDLRESLTISQEENLTEPPDVSCLEKLTEYSLVSQVEKLTEPSTVNKVEELTESPVVNQAAKLTEPSTVNKVEELTESHVVSQQVDRLTEPLAIRRRRGFRRKSAIHSKMANKSRSLTRTLLVLNTVFLLCNTPITVYLTGKAYFWPDATEYSEVQEIIVTVANFSMYTSNSINFILYCVTGSRFRGQLIQMFKELYRFVGNCTRRLSRVYKRRG